ncbi:MAG TPA: hypothetical protein VM598_04960, partial [Bdellovibrionota bacterium]|nr:hypothetical protein [Bdellovibrionota bacterium]
MRLDAIRASIRSLTRPELVLVAVALIAGVALRLVFPGDIEFKGDEAYNFAIAQEAGRSRD